MTAMATHDKRVETKMPVTVGLGQSHWMLF